MAKQCDRYGASHSERGMTYLLRYACSWYRIERLQRGHTLREHAQEQPLEIRPASAQVAESPSC